MAAKLRSDHGCTEHEAVGARRFTKHFRTTVQINGIWEVVFGVITVCAGEDAIGAEVNQPRPTLASDPRDQVGEGGVHGDRFFGMLSEGWIMLDDPNAVDKSIRVGFRQSALGT